MKCTFNYGGCWFPEKAVFKSMTNLKISVALETTQFSMKTQTDLMNEWVGNSEAGLLALVLLPVSYGAPSHVTSVEFLHHSGPSLPHP